ncbi:uncharacterized protein LOC123715015 [Pieris brassicae]|uniref:Kinetochore protein SPC25 n=1 Tax=Pieris brassicae TaxID=7116 RepID=A0A9P0XC15_PIEBR|nr:uncharacterized protein LOC123715015 [Pieris brassicae]CAH4032574.1 unnamed protein product [Pieris brassicae]
MHATEEFLDFDKLEEKMYGIFKTSVLNYTQDILNLFDNRCILQKPAYRPNSANTLEEELDILHQLNKNLKKEIDENLEKLSQKQNEYESFKQDHKLITNQIKETHESLLMARRCYKNFLNFYYTIESKQIDQQVIFIQFFTQSKRDSEKYSIRLLRNTQTGKYSLQEINPTLKNNKYVVRILEHTNNVPGVLAYIRQGFVYMKKHKK